MTFSKLESALELSGATDARSRFGAGSSVLSGLLATLCGLTLTACAFQKDPKSKEKSKIEELELQLDANRPLRKSDLKVTYEPMIEENEYMAKISWPENRPLQIKFSQDGKFMEAFDGRTTSSIVFKCRTDERIGIEVVSPQTGVVNDFDISMKCPVDFTIRNQVTPENLPTGLNGRLTLESKALIQLSDKGLDLNIQELIIRDSATIRTYHKDRHPKLNGDLSIKAGPPIRIRARSARGLLNLELNGVDGASAPNLKDTVEAEGLPGKDGLIEPNCKTLGKVDGGTETCKPKCSFQTGSGSPGADAGHMENGIFVPKIGAKGYDGKRAIGTSEVILDIAETQLFRIDIDFNPGIGGGYGEGALPKGGTGGAAGRNPGYPCQNAKKGPDGRDGMRGPRGDYGLNGSCGAVRVSQALLPLLNLSDRNGSCSKVPGIVRAL